MQPNTTVAIRSGGSSFEKYPAKQHAQGVAAQLKLNNGLILLQGTKTKYYKDSDLPIPFRQDRSFYYITGCNEPGCYVTYEVEKDNLTLWLPKVDLNDARIFYDGRGSTVEEAMQKYDVDECKYIQGPVGKPKRTNLRKVLFDHDGEYAFFKMPHKLIGKPLRKKMKEHRKIGLRTAVNQCRVIKDEHEIAMIRKANKVTAEAHVNIMKNLSTFTSETEAEGYYLGTCVALGAKEQAYGPICGAGKNAGQLHYVSNDQMFGKDAQVLLVDAGAEWQHYASDVTRTLPINPSTPGVWPTKEAEAIYNAVAKIQDECIKQLKPGKKFIEVHWSAVHMAIDALLDLGVLKGEHMEIFHAGTVLAFFPHGLGHHLGLEVHDVPPPAVKYEGGRVVVLDEEDGSKKKNEKDGKKEKQKKKVEQKDDAIPKAEATEDTRSTFKAFMDEVDKESNNNVEAAGKRATEARRHNVACGYCRKRQIRCTGHDQANGVGCVNCKVFKQECSITQKHTQAQAEGAAKDNGKNKGKGKAAKKNEEAEKKKDPRFDYIQRTYRAFCAGNESIFPQFLTIDPKHYSLNPATCMGPCTPKAPALKKGMVVTIEPGLYFNELILQSLFLNNEEHAKFIDKEVLKRYMGVGGVRIEDNILVTKDGYENLTSTPKGEEMLRIIREGHGAEGGGCENEQETVKVKSRSWGST